MRIYLCASYARRDELLGYRDDLIALGHDVTSRWLTGEPEPGDDGINIGGDVAQRPQFALDDYADICASDLMIAFTEPPRSPFSRGGRHVEAGIALGREIPLWVVGPVENVFYALPDVVRFVHWPGVLAMMAANRWNEENRHVDDVVSPEHPMDWSAVRLACLTWAAERLRCLFPEDDIFAFADVPRDVVDGLMLLFDALDGDMPLALLSERPMPSACGTSWSTTVRWGHE